MLLTEVIFCRAQSRVMELNKSTEHLEIHMEELVNETADDISQLKESTESLKINTEDVHVVDESELMKTIDYSNLDGRSQSGFTMLHHAAKEDRPDIIEFLVNAGCDINVGDDEGQTPLHKAAMFGNAESVKLLLEKGADVNKVDNSGHTPLHIAIITGGDVEVVSTLLTKANILIKNNDGQNALHLAITYQKVDSIDLLLKHRQASEVTAANCNYKYYTPLHLAVRLGHLDTVERLLKDQTPNIFKITKQGRTILHFAAATNNGAILPFLLDLQGTVSLINKPDINLHTPLHDAAMHGHLKQVILLMDRGATFSSAQNGYSPLHYACENGHLSVARKILERHPFQMHYVTKNQDTALHVAARNGYAAIVKFLLDSGTPITLNSQQVSFLDIALFNRDGKVASEAVKNDRWQECLDLVSPFHPAPMIHLVHALPEVAKMVMDHSITSAPLHPTHPNYWKKYDFKYLLDEPKSKLTNLEEGISKPANYLDESSSISTDEHKPPHGIWQVIWHYIWCIFTISDDDKANTFKVIKAMLEHDRTILLTHPLLLTFLNVKWHNYGRLALQIRLSVLVMIVVLLTILISISDPPRPSTIESSNDNNTATEKSDDRNEFHVLSHAHKGAHVTVAVITLIVNFIYMILVIFAIIVSIRLRAFSQ